MLLLNKRPRFYMVAIFLALFISAGVSTFSQTEASAANKAADMTIDDQAKSWWYYKALEHCLSGAPNSNHWLTGAADLEKGNFFAGTTTFNSTAGHGAIMRDTIGGRYTKGCKDSNNGFNAAAISLWGISGLDLICGEKNGINDANPEDNILNRSSGDCHAGERNFDSPLDGAQIGPGYRDRVNLILTRVANLVYDGRKPPEKPVGAVKYSYYLQTLKQSCIFGATASAERPNNGNYVYELAEMNDQGVMGTVYYTGQLPRSQSIFTWPNSDKESCNDLADAIKDPSSGIAKEYADYIAANESKAPGISDPGGGGNTTSCAIDGVGWIVCPVLNFMGNIADNAYGFLADNFLETPTALLRMDDDNAAWTAWRSILSIANVMFVIGFLFIVFSQLTGVGVSNYGIKKLLPRLIMGAVLINLSFFICAIAIDLSNILGAGLKQFLSGLVSPDSAMNSGAVTSVSNGGGWIGIVGTVTAIGVGGGIAIAAAGGVSMALIALMGVLISAVIALVMIFFILQIRQVLIVLLLVLSPIAFAAYLLPNTEQWFTRWRKLFTAMLLLYPIIGLIYGASSLASTVITGIYTNSDTGSETLGQIVGAGIMVLPLFLVPSVLKKALDGVGGIGGKLNAIGGKFGGKAKAGINGSEFAKHRGSMAAQRAAQIKAGGYNGTNKNPANWGANIRSSANSKINKSGAFNALTGDYGKKRSRAAQAWEGKEIRDKADGMAAYLDKDTGLPRNPEEIFDEMHSEHKRAYAGNDEKKKREARINLGAAQLNLTRANGAQGAEYIRDAFARDGAASPASGLAGARTRRVPSGAPAPSPAQSPSSTPSPNATPAWNNGSPIPSQASPNATPIWNNGSPIPSQATPSANAQARAQAAAAANAGKTTTQPGGHIGSEFKQSYVAPASGAAPPKSNENVLKVRKEDSTTSGSDNGGLDANGRAPRTPNSDAGD